MSSAPVLFRCLAAVLTSAAALFLTLPSPHARARPQLAAHAVIGAADRRPGAIAPGEIVTLFPDHAGPAEIAIWPNVFPRDPDDLRYMRPPYWASLGASRVFFDGLAAPIVYTLRGETQVVVPDAVAGRADTSIVVEYRGARSVPLTVPVAERAPAIFTLDGSGVGQAALLNETGCCNSVRNPAPRGSVVELYGTGEGRPIAGRWPVQVAVGGVPAPVQYASRLGILVVNFRVPDAAPTGDAVPLAISIAGRASPPGVTMAIRPAAIRVFVADRDLAAPLRAVGCDVADTPSPVDVAVIPLDDQSLSTVAALRSANPKVKVIALAGAADSATLRLADLLGANALLTRPLRREILLRRIRELAHEPPARY
jgi:uncharacterized protein (TIGR03437 family)